MECSKVRATQWKRKDWRGPTRAPDAWMGADTWPSLKAKRKTSSSPIWHKVSLRQQAELTGCGCLYHIIACPMRYWLSKMAVFTFCLSRFANFHRQRIAWYENMAGRHWLGDRRHIYMDGNAGSDDVHQLGHQRTQQRRLLRWWWGLCSSKQPSRQVEW